MRIIIDGDSCPVREEVYGAALRHRLAVIVVANHWLRTPALPGLELIVVDGAVDAADDWILRQVAEGDLVVTADRELLRRVSQRGARCLEPRGRLWTGVARPPDERARRPLTERDRRRFERELERLLSATPLGRTLC